MVVAFVENDHTRRPLVPFTAYTFPSEHTLTTKLSAVTTGELRKPGGENTHMAAPMEVTGMDPCPECWALPASCGQMGKGRDVPVLGVGKHIATKDANVHVHR